MSLDYGKHMIAEMPDRERPRERLEHLGSEALTDAELLAIILRSGLRGHSVLELARDVLNHFDNSLAQLAKASVSELCQVRGIGTAKAVEICAAFGLGDRLRTETVFTKPQIQNPDAVLRLFRERFRHKEQEELHALLLDTKNHLIKDVLVTIGLLDRTQFHPREVFRPAIRESSARVIIVHNHPSGDPKPSSADIAVTERVAKAGKLIDIEVADHIIIGHTSSTRDYEYYSFRREGLLPLPAET